MSAKSCAGDEGAGGGGGGNGKGHCVSGFCGCHNVCPNTGEIADSVAGSIDRAEEEEQQLKGSSRLKQA